MEETFHTKEKLPEVIYSPDSQLRRPGQMLKSMWHDILASRELAWRFFLRNISAMYRQTILSYIWAFLPPVFTTLTFVFLNSQKIFSVGETDIPYPAYVMIGTLLWQVFADAMNSPLRMITQSKSFLAKINFPREALILAGIGEVLFNFAIRLVLMIVVFLWYQIPVPLTVLYAPLGIFAMMALGLMFGVLLAPIGVLYQDIEKGLPLITGMWMLLTPVIYPPPTSWPASLLVSLNPVSPLLTVTREMITTGNLYQLTGFMVVLGLTLVLLFIGWILYRLALPHLIERISA
jgi:homopolymeric O-antigen transport system permease protein